MKMSIGVDLHKNQFTVCFLSEDRKRVETGIYPTKENGYEEFLGRCGEYIEQGYEVSTAVESTGNARYFRNRVLSAGVEVRVVNTLKFKVINESVKKTDKHDARTLAEFLEKDMLPESRLCSQMSEDLRRVIKTRAIAVRAIVGIKNQIHGMLLGYGIETKRGQLQSKKERQRILVGLADHKSFGNAAEAVQPLFDTIDQFSAQVKKLEKVLEKMIGADEEVKETVELLRTIPGIGLINASILRAYIDDIDRYSSPKKFAAHMGLVPWVQNSNEMIHHGRITKRGPTELRTAMVQCVLGMVRAKRTTGKYRIMTRYEYMKQYKGSGKSIIATARKLSTVIYMMLKNREPFDPARMKQSRKYKEIYATASEVAKAG